MTSQPSKSQPPLRAVGRQHILLTEAESRCFYVARDYQRKSLLRSLLPIEWHQWRTGFNRLGWSKNPLVLAVQWLVILVVLVPMCCWLLAKCCFRWIAFPFRYLQTFMVPRDLHAPGEKTLVGIHNAFNRHINLSAGEYIACLNDWIKILYGEDVSSRINLDNAIQLELKKSLRPNENDQFSEATRSLVAVTREKLSTQLGHYGLARHMH